MPLFIDDGTKAAPGSPLARFRKARDAADAILKRAKADGDRPMTSAELEQARKHLDEADAIKPELEAAAKAQAQVGDLFTATDHTLGGGSGGAAAGKGFRQRAAKSWADGAVGVLSQVAGQRSGPGQPASKALLGTVVQVGTILPVVMDPDLPNNVLQLIPREGHQAPANGDDTGNRFAYLVESSHTNAASSVADGGQKPESLVGLVEKVDRYRVFATLSEKLPERYLEDWPKVTQLLTGQLGLFVLDAIEQAVLSGNAATAAPKDDFNGLLNTSGVQSISAVSGDIPQTLVNARLALSTLGFTPSALAMAPADLSRLEMMKTTQGEYLWPGGRVQIAAFLGVSSIVESTKLTAATSTVPGVAYLADWSRAKLLVRSNATLKVIQPGSLAETNEFKFRLETSVGFQVENPFAFAKVSIPTTA